MIPRSVRHRLAPRRASRMIQSRYLWPHRRVYVSPITPLNRNWHAWQEYNMYGNTCHFPGCRLSEDQHAKVCP